MIAAVVASQQTWAGLGSVWALWALPEADLGSVCPILSAPPRRTAEPQHVLGTAVPKASVRNATY